MLYSHLSIIIFLFLHIFSLNDGINVTQNIPASIQAGSSFTVEVTIHKAMLTGFAKYEVELPEGFTASAEKTTNSFTSFSDRKIKFTWISLPLEQEFKISYKVFVPSTSVGNKSIGGTFAYVENNQPQKIYLPATAISITSSTLSEIVQQVSPSLEKKDISKSRVETNPIKEAGTPDAYAISYQEITFRIQLATKQTNVGKNYFKDKFHINCDINMENIEGKYRYSAGNFQTYNQAKELCDKIKQQGIADAFVVAYRKNQRISIKDALSSERKR
ncbi:MAG: SPOR domain-containing protein [Bacteroidetes bacterium]|nr:SPOR domain-containing protein [Bacteroidota bacterium]